MKHQYSLGLPQVDGLLAPIPPRSVFLGFHDDPEFSRTLIIGVAARSHASGARVSLVSEQDPSFLAASRPSKKVLSYSEFLCDKKLRAPSMSSLSRFLESVPTGAVMLGEYPVHGASSKSEKALLETLHLLSNACHHKNGFLFLSVRRSPLSPSVLAQIKELGTHAFDFFRNGQSRWCVPLAVKGAYVSLNTGIIRLDEGGKDPGIMDESELRLFQKSPDSGIIFSLSGDYRVVNKSCCEFFGKTRQELETASLRQMLPHGSIIPLLRLVVSLRHGKKQEILLEMPTPDGKNRILIITAAPLTSTLAMATLHDVTEVSIRSAKERERADQFLKIIESSPVGVVILHKNKILFANTAMDRIVGSERRGLLFGKSISEILLNSSVKILSKALKNELPLIDMRIVRSDAQERSCQVSIESLVYDGKTCHQLSFADISADKALIAQLTDRQQRHQRIADTMTDAVAIIRDEKVDWVNPAFLSLFGFERVEEALGKQYFGYIVEEDLQRVRDQFSKVLSGRTPRTTLEFRIQRKDGLVTDCEVTLAVSIKGSEVIAHHSDIGDRKELERKLSVKSSEAAIISEIASTIGVQMDLRKVLQLSLNKVLEVTGMESGALYLKEDKGKVLTVWHQKHWPEPLTVKLERLSVEDGLGGFAAKTLEPRLFTVEKYPSYLPFRSLWKQIGAVSIGLIPLVTGGQMTGLILLTSKKRGGRGLASELLGILGAEIGAAITTARSYNLIRNSESQLQTLIGSLSGIMFESGSDGGFTFVSPQIEAVVGYTPNEFYRSKHLWLSLVHPEDKPLLLERRSSLDRVAKSAILRYRVRPKGKAHYRWVSEETSAIRNEAGEVDKLQGIIRDITDEKSTIDTLTRGNEIAGSMLKGMQQGVMIFDRSLRCIEWNPAIESMIGRPRGDSIDQSAANIFDEDSRVLEEILREALRGETIIREDLELRHFTSHRKYSVSAHFLPVVGAGGDIVGVIGLFTDLTKRKGLEQELRESEQALRNVIDTMSDVLVITDLKGGIVQVNSAFTKILGYERNEVVGHEFPYPWLIEEEMGRYVLWITNLRERNWLHDFDMTWRTRDGRALPISLSTTLMKNAAGESVAMVNIARDITERKRLIRELESRSKQVELINRIITAANKTMDFDEIFKKIGSELERFLPWEEMHVALFTAAADTVEVYAAEGMGAPAKGTLVPLENTLAAAVAHSGEGLLVFEMSKEFPLHPGDVGFGAESAICIPIALKGRIMGTLTVAAALPNAYQDKHLSDLQLIAQQIGAIIDRVKLFAQVSDDALYIHTLLDSIDSVVYTVDRQFHILEVNKAWYDFVKESGSETLADYHGVNVLDIIKDTSLKMLFSDVSRDILSGTIRFFSQEFTLPTPSGHRIFQLTINPMVIERRITGLVITHTDITALKQTESELKRNNEQLLALNEISRLISTSLNLQEILDTALPLVKSTMEASAVALWLTSHGEHRPHLAKHVGCIGVEKELHPANFTDHGEPVKEPLYITADAENDRRLSSHARELFRQELIRSAAILPLTLKEETVGALTVCFRTNHNFTRQERQILSLMGNQLGTAVENAQLYAELRAQIERVTALYQFSQQLTSTLDINEIFALVNEHLERTIPYSDFGIDLYDANRRSLSPAFHVRVHGGRAFVVPKISEPFKLEEQTPEWKVIQTKRSFLDEGRKLMYVPMLSKESIIGIMSISNPEGAAFTDTHIRVLESIGNLTAIAFEKGKLYEETLAKSREIERRNKELDDFTYVVSHDLKEPLISIEGFAKILQADYQPVLAAEGQEFLDSIMGSAVRMKGLINDLLLLSRVGRTSEAFKEVSIQEVIDEIRDDFSFTMRQKNVSFIVQEGLPSVLGIEAHLKIVFRNLIGNALKFTDKAQPVVEIGFQIGENNSYLFHVKDNGIGIDKEFHEKIFVIFQRLHRREQYEGTGAGLAIVKKIIELHRGSIRVESEPGKGTTFFFALPRYEQQD